VNELSGRAALLSATITVVALGGLRALTKTMVAATAIAAGAEEKRGMAHLKEAWSRVGAGPIGNS